METLERIIGVVGIALAVVIIGLSVVLNWIWRDDPDEHADRDRRQP